MMKKIVAIALLAGAAFASDMDITLCKEKNYDCQVYRLKDVKKVERVADDAILRITYSNGNILDIKITGKVVDIKKKK